MKNRSGVTLIELVVAFALLGLVSLSVVGLMSTGANSFRRVSSEVSLQYEAQLTMSQLQEYLIDCSGGMCFSDDVLYIADFESDSDDGGSWVLHCFRRDAADAALYYWKGTVNCGGGVPSCTLPGDDSTDWALMSDFVGGFSVNPGSVPNSDDRFCTITLLLTTAGREYETEETLTFRNPVITAVSGYPAWLRLVCG